MGQETFLWGKRSHKNIGQWGTVFQAKKNPPKQLVRRLSGWNELEFLGKRENAKVAEDTLLSQEWCEVEGASWGCIT